MFLATVYYSLDMWLAFIGGLVIGAALTIFLLFLSALNDERKEERAEFEAWKKGKRRVPVVDAQFVIKAKPQLNSSQALVRRDVSLERRQQ